ncbi:MAG: aldehyde dehydrogenase family protein [bacterium]
MSHSQHTGKNAHTTILSRPAPVANRETSPIAGRVQSLDPATGEIWQEYDAATPEQVQAAVVAARAAQPAWGALTFAGRGDYLRRFANILLQRQMEIAQLITRENGKPTSEALVSEVIVSLDIVRYYLKFGEKILRAQRVGHLNPVLKPKRGRLVHEPLGVVGVISPWNYPFMLPLGAVVPALLAGNAVVLKPSEFTPAAALKTAELFTAAGLPEDVLRILIGEGATGAALTQCQLDRFVFTGSVATGRKVAQAAADRFIPVTLELGGSDALIVLREANLEYATSGAAWGRFMNCGQSCVAAKRVFVEEEIFTPFVQKLVEKVQRLRLGRGDDPNTDIGPMIRERQVAVLETQLADAVAHGASILCGGKRRPELGPYFFEPTVMIDVKARMKVMCEETFGPLLPIIPVKNADEAVRLANDTSFGLSASIWTNDLKRGQALARRLEAGTVMINDVISYMGMCEMAYGGVKSSGLGKTRGPEGLLDMVRTKYVDIDAFTFLRKPWWFRYTADALRDLQGYASFLHAPSWLKRLRSIPAALRLLGQKAKI